LWRLIELKMELLIQCVPAFLLAIHWPSMRARPAFWGLLVGTVVAVGLILLGVRRIGGVHVGIIGLGFNVIVSVVGSLRARVLPLVSEAS
jgi:Na+/proline symporter